MASELTLYEVMYILDPELSDEQLQDTINNVHQYVTSIGGEVESDELFGRRRLAYQINRHTEGIYRVMYFRGTKHTPLWLAGVTRWRALRPVATLAPLLPLAGMFGVGGCVVDPNTPFLNPRRN